MTEAEARLRLAITVDRETAARVDKWRRKLAREVGDDVSLAAAVRALITRGLEVAGC
jgi:hypothetical protein